MLLNEPGLLTTLSSCAPRLKKNIQLTSIVFLNYCCWASICEPYNRFPKIVFAIKSARCVFLMGYYCLPRNIIKYQHEQDRAV